MNSLTLNGVVSKTLKQLVFSVLLGTFLVTSCSPTPPRDDNVAKDDRPEQLEDIVLPEHPFLKLCLLYTSPSPRD